MIFSIILIIFLGVIAFFHFIQGFFSAMLSAIFVVIAAVFAFSYHESVVERLLGGRMADDAHAMALLVLFGVIYLALRIIFDNAVPGNVRLPVGIDKAGAAVMGIIAGIFATGILAIAAQELPFGATIAGYSRYDVNSERGVVVRMNNGRDTDSKVWDALTADKPGEWGDQHGLLIPVDDIVVGTVRKLSASDGALESGRPLAAMHPDFLQELYGQRAGSEIGAARVAMNLPAQHLESLKVLGLFTVPSNIPEKDAEYAKIRAGGALKDIVRPSNSQEFLVVRAMFGKAAADPDGFVRFGPGAARLVVPKRGEEGEFIDLYPVGTLDSDLSRLWLNKPDDFLYVNTKESDKGADLVYIVDKGVFDKGAPEGAFLEFKRMARVDLSGERIKGRPSRDENIDVMRKPMVIDPNWAPGQPFPQSSPPPPPPPPQQPAPGAQSTAQPAPAAAKPSFQYTSATVSADLPVPITAPAGATGFTQVPGGTASLKEGKADSLDVTSSKAAQTQATTIAQALVPAGQVMVKVDGSAAPTATSPWQCVTEADQIELVDSTGKHYQPFGVYATYGAGRVDKFVMQYVSKRSISGVTQPQDAAGGPKDVTFMFLVPQGTTINELDDHQQKIQQLSLTANK